MAITINYPSRSLGLKTAKFKDWSSEVHNCIEPFWKNRVRHDVMFVACLASIHLTLLQFWVILSVAAARDVSWWTVLTSTYMSIGAYLDVSSGSSLGLSASCCCSAKPRFALPWASHNNRDILRSLPSTLLWLLGWWIYVHLCTVMPLL